MIVYLNQGIQNFISRMSLAGEYKFIILMYFQKHITEEIILKLQELLINIMMM